MKPQNNNRILCLSLLLLAALGVAGLVLLACGHVHLVCYIWKYFKIYCPGCGSGRALYALVRHLDLPAALSYNFMFTISIPLAIYGLVIIYCKAFFHVKWRVWVPETGFWICYFIVLVVFTVLRNIPVFPFTVLAP